MTGVVAGREECRRQRSHTRMPTGIDKSRFLATLGMTSRRRGEAKSREISHIRRPISSQERKRKRKVGLLRSK